MIGVADVVALDMTPEASYGTAAATPDKRWAFRGARPAPVPKIATNASASTGLYNLAGTVRTVVAKKAEASFEVDANMDNLAAILKMVLGACATTGTGTFTHTITPKEGDIDSYTLFWKDEATAAGKMEAWTGAKPRRVTIRGTAGEGYLTASVDFALSGSSSEVTATPPARNTDTLLIFADISVFTIGGTDYKNALQEFEFVFERVMNEDREYSAGSTALTELRAYGYRISGRIVLKRKNNVPITWVDTAATSKMVLTITSGTHSATFTGFKVGYEDGTVDGQKELLRKPLSLTFHHSDADSKTFEAVVINGTAAYT